MKSNALHPPTLLDPVLDLASDTLYLCKNSGHRLPRYTRRQEDYQVSPGVACAAAAFETSESDGLRLLLETWDLGSCTNVGYAQNLNYQRAFC